MSHDELEAALDRLIDEHAALIAAAREVVQRARFGYETTHAVAKLGVELDKVDGKRGEAT